MFKFFNYIVSRCPFFLWYKWIALLWQNSGLWYWNWSDIYKPHTCHWYMQKILILHDPPFTLSALKTKSKGRHKQPAWLQNLLKSCQSWYSNTFRVICMDLLPLPFPCLVISVRQHEFKNKVFLPQQWVHFWVLEHHQSEAPC